MPEIDIRASHLLGIMHRYHPKTPPLSRTSYIYPPETELSAPVRPTQFLENNTI